MAIARVGGGSQMAFIRGAGVDSANQAYPANVGAGNLLTSQFGGWSPTADTSMGHTDSQGNTWTVGLGTSGVGWASGTGKPAIAHAIAGSSGANTVTVNPSGSGDYFNATLDEWSGVHVTTPNEVAAAEATGTSTTPNAPGVTVAGEALILGVTVGNNSQGPYTEGASFTLQEADTSGDRQPYCTEFRIVTTGGTYAVPWTTYNNQPWSAMSAAYRVAGAAPSGRVFALAGEGGGLVGPQRGLAG
jgi:hypothetical protein